MIAVVIKSFTCAGSDLRPGTVVDTAAWRNRERMLRARQIRPASSSEVAEFEASQKKKRA